MLNWYIIVFENFRNKCLGIHELGPVYFISVPGLAWQVCFKKTEVKLELINNRLWHAIDDWKRD